MLGRWWPRGPRQAADSPWLAKPTATQQLSRAYYGLASQACIWVIVQIDSPAIELKVPSDTPTSCEGDECSRSSDCLASCQSLPVLLRGSACNQLRSLTLCATWRHSHWHPTALLPNRPSTAVPPNRGPGKPAICWRSLLHADSLLIVRAQLCKWQK